MLKVALKHYIYELCINILFEKIKLNFDGMDIYQKILDDTNHVICMVFSENVPDGYDPTYMWEAHALEDMLGIVNKTYNDYCKIEHATKILRFKLHTKGIWK